MRWVSVILIAGALLGSGATAVAQESDARSIAANPVGEPVTVYNAQADEAAQFTVTEVVDDFEDYAEFYEPQRNERYVFVAVEIENTGERSYEFLPYDLFLLDSVGELHSQGFVQRSDSSMVDIPELAEADMLPGESVSGGMVFVVPNDAELVQVVFLPYNDVRQLYLLADLTQDVSAETTDADTEATPES